MDDVRRHARRAYERARLRAAVPWALPALLLSALGASLGSTGAWPIGAALAVVLVGLRWHGREPGAAAPIGLAAGAVVATVIAGWMQLGPCCGDGCSTSCTALCSVAGLAAAGLIATYGGSRAGLTAALAVASLAAATACLAVGLPGLIGVAVLWAAATPRLVLAPS